MSPASHSLRKLRAQFDWFLAGAILAITTIGLINLYSATRVAPGYMFRQQIWWFGVGTILFVAAAAADYRKIERLAYPIYIVGLVVLVAVLVGGKTVNGSRRWLGFGSFGIQ